MNFREHEDKRAWILSGLASLGSFVREDDDFRGNRSYEQKAIGYQHQIVEDGKYRVVFLGAFNVGKSTAINAFLGGDFLPMDVEECTSRLTFIQRGGPLQIGVRLHERASESEVSALDSLLSELPASVSSTEDGREIRVAYPNGKPAAMRKSLAPLVTVVADEEYPLLAPFRDKIDEINLFLPSDVLEEDIVFVDTPGVHSVSETRQEITFGIIEHSHLVICFVDSNFAGNIHDLNFIKRIMTLRGRHVFFVLNKADKIDPEEIDLRAAHGPAWSLLQAFKRHGLPDNADIFFFSGYRALRAQQLERGLITLQEVLDDNRVSIPTSVVERIRASENPVRDLAAYLMGQSRLPHLKERLLDYLLNENKAGKVLETAAKFIRERASDFVISLENELNLAKDPSLFEELRSKRESLMAELEAVRTKSEAVMRRYDARCMGGEADGVSFNGYERMFRDAMVEGAINVNVVQPILGWLRLDNNLKESRRGQFKPLAARIEHQVDEFVSGILANINGFVDETERMTRDEIAEHLREVRGLHMQLGAPGAVNIENVRASMAGGYAAFGAGGAVVGAAAGAAVGSVVPVLGTAIGAGLGGLLGVISGFLARLAWSEDRWIRKLSPVIRENVMNMLIRGGKDHKGNDAPPMLESVTEYLNRRGAAFREAVQEEVDNAVGRVQRECDELIAREEEIRREREAIITRLEPKVSMLHTVREEAETVISNYMETRAETQ